MKIQRILVATDLSETAAQSYPYAAALAKPFAATVTLLHVDELMDMGFQGSTELSDHLNQLTHAREQTLKQAALVFNNLGVDVQVRMEEGTPWRKILEVAEQRSSDLVIVTKQGARGLERLLMGSTTTRLVRHSSRPIMVIPSSDIVEEMPTLPRIQRILTTTDFSEDSDRGSRYAVSLTQALDGTLILLHVLRLPTLVSPLPGETMLLVPDELRGKLEYDASSELEGRVRSLEFKGIEPQVSISFGVAEEIASTADKLSDLIVIPSHGKSAIKALVLGSTVAAVIKHATKPVLVLPHEYLQSC